MEYTVETHTPCIHPIHPDDDEAEEKGTIYKMAENNTLEYGPAYTPPNPSNACVQFFRIWE
jgi:hypothetical protein